MEQKDNNQNREKRENNIKIHQNITWIIFEQSKIYHKISHGYHGNNKK